MTDLSDLRPKAKPRLLDLVKAAGVDVSDWEASWPANPKYCYEWAFGDPDGIAAITIWYPRIESEGGALHYRFVPSQPAFPSDRKRAVFQRRQRVLFAILNEAYARGTPLRAIISDGVVRDLRDLDAEASQVKRRSLDPLTWWVTSFDRVTDSYTLVRGDKPIRIVDQFDVGDAVTRTSTTEVFVRDAEVRNRVRARSEGRCEWCKIPGFKTANGDLYIETHHIIPLSEGGRDRDDNVVALCPQHHREAHYGADRLIVRERLLNLRMRAV